MSVKILAEIDFEDFEILSFFAALPHCCVLLLMVEVPAIMRISVFFFLLL